MAEESNAWVFDSLIGFLHGPVWNAPLQTFIEEKSTGKLNKGIFFPLENVNFFTAQFPIKFSIRMKVMTKIARNTGKFMMNISIWWILCWAVLWKKCK